MTLRVKVGGAWVDESAAAVLAHATDTTNVHGIADTADVATVAIYVSDTAPEDPTVNVVWIDTGGA